MSATQPEAPRPFCASSSEVFLDVTRELLSLGHRVRFRAEGGSMHPTIRSGEAVIVEPVSPSNLKKGDISLYHAERGITAHRVVRHQGNLFVMRGDAAGCAEEPIDRQQILGKVVTVERKGRSISLITRRAKMKSFIAVRVSRLARSLRSAASAAIVRA